MAMNLKVHSTHDCYLFSCLFFEKYVLKEIAEGRFSISEIGVAATEKGEKTFCDMIVSKDVGNMTEKDLEWISPHLSSLALEEPDSLIVTTNIEIQEKDVITSMSISNDKCKCELSVFEKIDSAMSLMLLSALQIETRQNHKLGHVNN